MLSRVNVAVIGGGIFGAEIALKANSLGLSVKIFEAKADLLAGASNNNQNRLHLGFHYPRDLETGRQSIRGFEAFRLKYAECIQGGFPNAYFVADEKSLTDPLAYIKFCKQLGLPFHEIESKSFPVTVLGATTGILCDEVVYDCNILRQLVWRKIRQEEIDVALNQRVVRLERSVDGYQLTTQDGSRVASDVVINACYGDINRLTEQLGFEITENLYEYTAVPIIKVDMPRVGVTIMDGPFMTVLPHGKSDNFLLYNVKGSVVASSVSKMMDPSWLAPETAPFASIEKLNFFKEMLDMCARYVPALAKSELIGFLQGPRMVLARKDDSDARPSIVTDYGGGYFSVFAGKIDHSIWVAEEIEALLKSRLRL